MHERYALLLASLLSLCACSSSPSSPTDAAVDAPAADVVADAAPQDASRPSTPRTVMTSRGAVNGLVQDGVARYLGVPYAAPPVGDLRWRPPREPDAWTTPLDATQKGPSCPQARGTLAGNAPMSEDCLKLNVWAPATASDAQRRPVMVFVHGGGFTGGTTSGPDYDGQNLAARGVVVVTFNYRLGQLGFLAHPRLADEDTEHRSSGNYGFMDQQAALRWVRANIASFGGDPAKVTLFGESAGSISVCAHMVSPLSEGLFHRAISQSGPCAFVTTPMRDMDAQPPLESAFSLGRRFVQGSGCPDDADLPRCLRALPATRVIETVPTPVELTRYGARYQPSIDGYVFTERPWASFAMGRFRRVPFLSGTNRDEGTVFTLMQPVNDQAAYEAAVRALLPDRVSDVMALYPAAMYGSPKAAFEAFLGDAVFICPARAQARFVAATGTRAWLYHFTRLNRAGTLLRLGVFHSAELPYVFGNFGGIFTRSPEDTPVSEAMMGYWVRFAETGDPNGAGAPMWPAYTAMNDTHLEIGDRVRADTGLRRDRCDVLERWLLQ